MICGAQHPDCPATCNIRGEQDDHDEHVGYHNGVIEWPNLLYQAKVKEPLQRGIKGQMLDLVHRAVNGPEPASEREFGGDTYIPEFDRERLGKQLQRTYDLMIDGNWRTLSEIGAAITAPESSVSARLRDLRKPEYGAHILDRRRRGEPSAGLYEYRITAREEIST